MKTQLLVSMHDLRYATISCPHCFTRVILDFESEFQPPRSPFVCPTECPRCNSHFDSAVPKAVESMQSAYKALARVEEAALTFTVDRD